MTSEQTLRTFCIDMWRFALEINSPIRRGLFHTLSDSSLIAMRQWMHTLRGADGFLDAVDDFMDEYDERKLPT